MGCSNLSMLRKTGTNADSDECYTPPEAIFPLLRYIDKSKIWYEATSGTSNSIVKCMQTKGFKAIESSVDFFDYNNEYDGIITNPPYSQKDKFLKRCYELGKPFALLLPVSSIQGIARGKLFIKHGVQLLVLSKRIDFTGKGNPHFGVAWFCSGILPEQMIFSGGHGSTS